MLTKKWVLGALAALSMSALGLAYGIADQSPRGPGATSAYVCPLTGAELPCPGCCPLNGG